jgi:LPXTG-motif cell wall-anchored protein
MKRFIVLPAILVSAVIQAQDSSVVVEPQKTSFEDYDLLWMAAVGLVLLVGLYFLFRRTRSRRS